MNNIAPHMERTVLIKNELEQIKILKDQHQMKSDKLKKTNDVLDIIIISTGSISTSIQIIGLSALNPLLIAIGAGFGFISTFLSVISKTINYNDKYLIHKNTSNTLSDLYRDCNNTLAKNGLSSDEKQHMLNDIGHRLSIIENSSLPL
jgi:hypothetical protein